VVQLSGQSVLVTGAGGFIGSHLVEHLVAQGCRVRALVRYNSGGSWGWLEQSPPAVRDSIEVMVGDIRDPHHLERVVEGCQVIFHLAALIAIPYSYHAPDSFVQTNVTGTLNLLQAARRAGVARVVHTSTSEVYGTAQTVPIGEDHPLQAQSPYAASKIGADQMALSFHRSFGLPVSVARPFNAYGPRQSARAVIPTIITQIAGGARRVRLGSLHPTRDFTYVGDLAAGFAAVAASDQTVGRVVNLGSGFEIAIGELAELIAAVMGTSVELEQDQQRVRPAGSEVERLWADNRLARELTGWQPSHGGIEGLTRGLERTVQWLQDPANLGRYKPQLYNI